jgi:FHS family L-fucose permease-like MFS transporter
MDITERPRGRRTTGQAMDGLNADTNAGTIDRQASRTIMPLVLIVSLFFLWGMANNLNDVLITHFKKVFTLTDLQAGLVQSAFYMGYFLVAMPAGLFMRRFGYKSAVVFGLLLYGIGALLFWPAASTGTYGFFLFALFVIAGGLAFLETSANPFVTLLGPAHSATRRLNLAQAFNPLGSITGVLIGQHFIFSSVEHSPAELASMEPTARAAWLAQQATSVQIPYLVIGVGVIFWALLILLTRFPVSRVEARELPTTRRGVIARLLGDKGFVFALTAQFFYVGAQVGVWSFLIRYVQFTAPGTPAKEAANFLTASLISFMVGRFAGTALMRRFPAARLLLVFAAINVLLAGVAMFWTGTPGACALVACSFFMSVMYPTIFALGVKGRGDDERKLGSALLVMTIIGGAVLTAVMGEVSDLLGMARAMVVPLIGFVVVWLFARRHASSAEL